ncbi:MAG: GFA family protein [Roseiarcus sp.]
MAVELPAPPFAGGCQCGAVRYRLTAVPTRANICHCRMCQKAGGAPFMAFTGVKLANLAFTRGVPAKFSSSDIAERGFCAACGTPLTYQMKGRNRISVTIGSLDDPAMFAPGEQLGIEGRLPWFATLAALPEQRTEDWLGAAKIENVGNRQHPDRET